MDTEQQTVNAPELALPQDGSSMSNTTSTETPPAAPSQEAAAAGAPKKEVYFAGRRFESEAEALAYASTLAPQAPQTPANTQAPEEVDPGDIWFEDPKAAARLIKEQVRNEMRREYTAVETQKKVWNDFYEKNKDLKGLEEFVEAAQARKWNEIKAIPIEQALEKVAKEARSMIHKARGTSGTTERLTSNGATTATPSHAPGVNTPVHTAKPTSFVDELKALREKRKRVV